MGFDRSVVGIKAGFSLATESESESESEWESGVINCVGLNDLVKSSEWQAEAEELNQSQSVGTCFMIGLSFRFCFLLRQYGFQ